ncbi:16S rRNA (cytidine(1402)-2'-O)-methyltransferase [Alsobacter soli]|uniref:Ribosomal RNA small subunit methyltransferase I n=1 Tax=Alsobacter soli TaxID=2109933 RepID=A0A2T1HTG5_9HYPH|nr:16S rRNA (cytidine(1402)-2'-O)-methyltransferase [Alsobacter soli]PSC04937.1 16S rRNA (cytidine(1402)-2'-O)-methyltransferase [Alsobacter soli]
MTQHSHHGTGAERLSGFTAFGMRAEATPIAPGLHVVATPIGNLGDVSFRALGTLAAAAAVLAEDTRVTKTLLAHYGITTPLIPYHEHNAEEMRPRILARLKEGEALALVSDAGTPLVSDPGFKLVQAALAEGLPVTGVPGPSAVLAALVVAGLPTDRFFFEGFLPPKSAARRERLEALRAVPGTLVFFESPRRVAEMLADARDVLGERPAAVARELTKYYENVRRGSLTELAERYAGEDAPKGEIVVLIGPPGQAAEASAAESEEAIDAKLRAHLGKLSVKDAVAIVAQETGMPRKRVYARAVALVKE